MNQLSLLKPSYIVNLKLGKVADFRKIPRKELSHYFEPNHYKTSTIMGRVIPYKEHCKCAYNSKTKTGLFPPEVLLIHTINNEGRPYPLAWGAKYSDFWWFECGIIDVASHIKKLEKEGYIIVTDGHYSVTALGKNELKQNKEIIWAYDSCYRKHGLRLRGNIHRSTPIGGIWDIKETGKYRE